VAGDVSHHGELKAVVRVDVSSAGHPPYAREFSFQIANVRNLRGDSELAAEGHDPQVRTRLQSAQTGYRSQLGAQIECFQPGIGDFCISRCNQSIRPSIERHLGAQGTAGQRRGSPKLDPEGGQNRLNRFQGKLGTAQFQVSDRDGFAQAIAARKLRLAVAQGDFTGANYTGLLCQPIIGCIGEGNRLTRRGSARDEP
jgi:hypothetical protein